ncbi:MAG: serine hydrolase, partial [Parvibaculum sp.]
MSKTDLPPLPAQPAGVPWPTSDWPKGELPDEMDKARFTRLMDKAFAENPSAELGETFGTVIVKGGRLIHEQYAQTHGPEHTCPSWSKAKSITHA